MQKRNEYGKIILSVSKQRKESAVVVKELKSFSLFVDGYSPFECETPASLVSVLADNKIIKDIYYDDNVEEVRALFPLAVSFYTEFDVDNLFMSYKHLYLELSDVDAPLTVLLNGNPIAGVAQRSAEYLFDVRTQIRFGKNRLELRYDARDSSERDYLTDIALVRPPRLLGFNHARIDNLIVSEDYSESGLTLSLDLGLVGSTEGVRAVATLISPGGSVSYSGFNGTHGEMKIASPELWSPGELGSHSLYRLSINLYADSLLCDSYETTVGFRDLALVEKGGDRRLKLGGLDYFPLGAVHIKEDNVKPWIDEERLETILDLASRAGINTLLIKDRGELPSEEFLYLADRFGISLWIELPTYQKASTEPEKRVKRANIAKTLKFLSVHPSLTLLIGGGDDTEMIKELVGALVPNVIYLDAIPEVETFGIPSLPPLPTVRSFAPDEELNFLSPTIEKRCTSHLLDLLGEILAGYRMPHSFDEFIYLTELLSAKHAERRALSARRDLSPFGAIFDRLSDTIPKPSSSAIDYYLRPKALWYYASRFNRPTVVFAEADGTRVKFFVSNLLRKIYKGKLIYSLTDPKLGEVFRDTVAFSVDPHSSTMIYECDLSEIVSGRENELCLSYSITDSVGASSYGTHYFVPMRYFGFEKPNVSVEITGTGREYLVSVSTDKLAASVALDFGDERVVLDDNYFDLTSPAPRQIKLHTLEASAVEALRRKLKVTTLYDVGRFD